jgi:hypothetical protein
MAEWSYTAIDKITTGPGDIPCNGFATDSWYIVPSRSTGLGVSPIRGSDDERGQDDGLILHPRFYGGQMIALMGLAYIKSSGTDAGYLTARDTLITDTRTKLKAIVNADGTLHFTGGQTITVRARDIGAPQSDQPDPAMKSMLMLLVSATPA